MKFSSKGRHPPWKRAWQPTPAFLPGEFPWTKAQWASTVLRVAQSWTQLKQFSIHTCAAFHFGANETIPDPDWVMGTTSSKLGGICFTDLKHLLTCMKWSNLNWRPGRSPNLFSLIFFSSLLLCPVNSASSPSVGSYFSHLAREMESHLLGLPHPHTAYLQEVSRDHYKAHFICFLNSQGS